MGRSTKDAWLTGPTDLREADVEDVPVEGQSVRVRGLPAAYSNDAASEALTVKTTAQGEQITTVDQTKLEVLQFAHGVIDPVFTVEETEAIFKQRGPSVKKVIAKIDELSGVDKEAIEKAAATFPAGERDSGGASEAVADGTAGGSG